MEMFVIKNIVLKKKNITTNSKHCTSVFYLRIFAALQVCPTNVRPRNWSDC